jgi:hypothetical protein
MNKLTLVARKGIVTQSVIATISAAIALFIGIWVISSVISSINQGGWTTTANTTYTNVQTTMWNALQLLSVGLIVLAASVILAYFGLGRTNQ